MNRAQRSKPGFFEGQMRLELSEHPCERDAGQFVVPIAPSDVSMDACAEWQKSAECDQATKQLDRGGSPANHVWSRTCSRCASSCLRQTSGLKSSRTSSSASA